MQRVRVELGQRSYEILIGRGLLSQSGRRLRKGGIDARKLFVISNPMVHELHGLHLEQGLQEEFDVSTLLIPEGEEHKSISSCQLIWTALIEGGADRGSCLVALGGGVTGDIAGFAAAAFMRGIDYVHVPTTLLAQVDSSVGGKTGVNHPLGKNLIGAFHQPRLVLIDPETLATLSKRDFRSGLYEAVKYGLIRDGDFFGFFEEHLDSIQGREHRALERCIRRSCEIKAAICSRDEREAGLRRILNFGHTFGHALEAATDYQRMTHGEAIGHGQKAAAVLSRELGRISAQECRRVLDVLDRIGPRPGAGDIPWVKLFKAMRHDKKRSAGDLRFVVLEGLGEAEVVPQPDESLLERCWAEAVGGP